MTNIIIPFFLKYNQFQQIQNQFLLFLLSTPWYHYIDLICPKVQYALLFLSHLNQAKVILIKIYSWLHACKRSLRHKESSIKKNEDPETKKIGALTLGLKVSWLFFCTSWMFVTSFTNLIVHHIVFMPAN